jgi:hypothetical protein
LLPLTALAALMLAAAPVDLIIVDKSDRLMTLNAGGTELAR